MNIEEFVRRIPKVELHMHIEGSLEPELMFACAERNGIALRYSSVDEVRRAYQFTDLQSFLDIYYEAAQVLVTEDDFHAMTLAYLRRAAAQNVRHTEMFFDPQTHTERGIAFDTVLRGLTRAQHDAEQELGITSGLILCFLRHLSADDAMRTLELALPHSEALLGVGLDSSEVGHPPEKFIKVFERAREHGLRAVAHAGEEGPPEYIWQALDLLQVSRIDHGVRCIEDERLVATLRERAVPLTVCPLSNVRLCVFEHMQDHNLRQLLERGLHVTVNSDDPAYFGGYINENLLAAQAALGLAEQQIHRLSYNAITAAFVDRERRQQLLAELDAFMCEHAS